jgi:hypothetical protein
MQPFISTTYSIRVYATEGAQFNFEFTPADGFTDSFAIAFAEAVRGLTWPAGLTPTVTADKTVREDDVYQADLTAASPSFT